MEVRPGIAAVGIAGGHEALSSRISDRIQYIHPQDVMFNSAHPTRSRAEFKPLVAILLPDATCPRPPSRQRRDFDHDHDFALTSYWPENTPETISEFDSGLSIIYGDSPSNKTRTNNFVHHLPSRNLPPTCTPAPKNASPSPRHYRQAFLFLDTRNSYLYSSNRRPRRDSLRY